MCDVTAISWPTGRLGEAIAALGRHSGLELRAVAVQDPPAGLVEEERGARLGTWIEATAAWLGLEAEPVEAGLADLERLIRGAGPALLRLAPPSGARFLALLGGDRGRRQVAVLSPGGDVVRVPTEVLCEAVAGAAGGSAASEVDRVLDAAGLLGTRRLRAREALLRGGMGPDRLRGCWLLRPGGASSAAAQAREARLPRLLAGLLAAHAGQYVLWLLSWWLLGWMAISGRFDLGWLMAWLLLLLTLVPCRLLTTYLAGRFSIRAGAWFKRRLLAGALKLGSDEVRRMGIGQLLGRVVESEVVESMALAGGALALTAMIELVLATCVLGAGAGGWVHVLLLAGTLLAAAQVARSYFHRRQRWTRLRLDLTDDLVESMIGHRTRLAQEPRRSWNEGEDQFLERYLAASMVLDRTGVALRALVPRCWLILGLLGLVPAFAAGGRPPSELAIGIGGVLLAYRALKALTDGLEQILAAAIAWERIRPIWDAASRPEPLGLPAWSATPRSAGPRRSQGQALLDVRDLVFRHPGRDEPVLRRATMRIDAGDRVLLEGPSGGGKSTLASLLAGERAPASGSLLMGGLDRAAFGAGASPWRPSSTRTTC
jgi:ATP-binding cassette subfamily B protein